MKLVAVTRIRNDDDIVECFVQHHARIVDQHIFLDNGCDEATLGILAAMKDDGYRLSVFRSVTPEFAEAVQNTFLLHRATEAAADWVVFLDTDEFVDERFLGTSLRDHLAAVPPGQMCVPASLRNYLPTEQDDTDEPVVPRRMRFRDPRGVDLPKVMVRGALGRLNAVVERGNHAVSLNGQPVPMLPDPRLILAHYPARSGWQMLAKALVGRLKVLASGGAEERLGTSAHYTGVLEFLRTHPAALLRDTGYLTGRWAGDWLPAGLLDDPLPYQGGDLRVTPPHDPTARAVLSLLAYLEDLAREHGRLLDAVPAARAFARAQATTFAPVL